MSGTAELDTEEITRLLDLLDQHLKKRAIAAEIYVFGGAAIALAHGRPGVTPDIDATSNHVAVLEEVAVIARAEGLPDSWLNSAGAGWLPQRRADSREAPQQPGLTVRIAPDEHLLAMKLIAGRRKDRPDVVRLVDALDMADASAADFEDLIRRVYTGENQLADLLGVSDDHLDTEIRLIAKDAVRMIRRSS